MYVRSVVLRKCVGLLVAIFWNSEIHVYRIWNYPICSCHAAEVFFFSAAKILLNPKLENIIL